MNDEIKKTLINIYSETDDVCKNFSTLLKMIIYDTFGEKIEIFYTLIDNNDLFCKILDMFGEKTLEFPTVDDFKNSITLALVYYYKEILGYDWKKIEDLIPYERDISLRYGGKIKKLQKSIKKYLMKMKEKHNDEEENIFDE